MCYYTYKLTSSETTVKSLETITDIKSQDTAPSNWCPAVNYSSKHALNSSNGHNAYFLVCSDSLITIELLIWLDKQYNDRPQNVFERHVQTREPSCACAEVTFVLWFYVGDLFRNILGFWTCLFSVIRESIQGAYVNKIQGTNKAICTAHV